MEVNLRKRALLYFFGELSEEWLHTSRSMLHQSLEALAQSTIEADRDALADYLFRGVRGRGVAPTVEAGFPMLACSLNWDQALRRFA